MKVWRFIPLLDAPGSLQMAIDSWLLAQHVQGLQPPILRFYTWSPAAISLGYHQRQQPEFWQHLSWQGQPLDLVRRLTGGRAVLHQGDLTYMAIASDFSGSRMQTYEAICQFLIAGWRSLGLELFYGSGGRGYIHHPSCFSAATAADLVTASGAKFIGSAQLKQGKAILQHGSMRLNQDEELFARVFGETLLPVQLPLTQPGEILVSTAIEALKAAAAACFDMELVEQPLADAEWQAIRQYERSLISISKRSPNLGTI